MDADTLKNVGMVAGIGGVALAVLMTVFREVIQKNIFAQLDPQSGYRLLRLILLLTWSVAIIGVGAWLLAKRQDNPTPTGQALKEFTIVGLITDSQDNAIPDASVSVVGKGSFVRSDSSGAFTLTTWIGDDRDVIVRITKDGYRPETQAVTLPAKNLIVALERGAATAVSPAAGINATQASPSRQEAPLRGAAGPADDTAHDGESPVQTRGTVSVQYLGDALGCVLNLRLRMGGQDFAPVGNPFVVTNVTLGATQYAVVGNISCPSTAGAVACVASGVGPLVLRNGAAYNIAWQNTAFGQCQVGLTPAN